MLVVQLETLTAVCTGHCFLIWKKDHTGYFLSEGLILASINQKFVYLITRSVQGNYKYIKLFLWHSEQFDAHKLYWTQNSMNDLLSYFGLIDARMSSSEKE